MTDLAEAMTDWAEALRIAAKNQEKATRHFQEVLGQVEMSRAQPCTCHPDDNPPIPCPQKYAFSDCLAAVDEAFERDSDGAQAATEEAAQATHAESERLMDLARRCDTDTLRDEATEALENVVKSHEPPPPPRFRW